jgi:hypothetical protein
MLSHMECQPLLYIVFADSDSPPVSPLRSVQAFHDPLVILPFAHEQKLDDSPYPLRSYLPDNVPVVFMHNDLHPSKIMMLSLPAEGESPRVMSILISISLAGFRYINESLARPAGP